jgi:hypothetical protein
VFPAIFWRPVKPLFVGLKLRFVGAREASKKTIFTLALDTWLNIQLNSGAEATSLLCVLKVPWGTR